MHSVWVLRPPVLWCPPRWALAPVAAARPAPSSAPLAVTGGVSAWLERAIDRFSRDLSLDPSCWQALAGRGAAKLELGLLEDGLLDLTDAVRIAPGHAGLIANRASVLAAMGRGEDALAEAERAIRKDPRLAEARVARGNAHMALGRPAHALDAYNEALKLDRRNAVVYFDRGNAQRALGRLEAALSDYNEAILIGFKGAAVRTNRALVLRLLGRAAEAIDELACAESLEPGDAIAPYDRAHLLMEIDHPEEAATAALVALRADPALAPAGVLLGNAHLRCGDEASAEEAYRHALEIAPGSLAAGNNLAALLWRRGRVGEARELWESLAYVHAEHPAVMRGLAA
jgi:tetratricopeptide (TPR) repeat protein